MIRNLKALGLALVAVFAMSAVAASASSAATFHSDKAPTILTGNALTTQEFSIPGSGLEPVKCKKGTFTGTAKEATETTLTLHPKYEECTFGGEPATVDTTGCNYIFSSTTNATGHLPASIECEGTKKITVTNPLCNLSFGAQLTVGGVKSENTTPAGEGATMETNTRDVDVTATSEATFTKSGPFCFLIAQNKGLYAGKATLRGYEDPDNVTEGTTEEGFTYPHQGAQVGIWWE